MTPIKLDAETVIFLESVTRITRDPMGSGYMLHMADGSKIVTDMVDHIEHALDGRKKRGWLYGDSA